jgi:plastocyanin
VRRLWVFAAVLTLTLGAPAGATSHTPPTRTYVGRVGPIRIPGFEVRYDTNAVKPPHVDGYITGMRADVVDRLGRPIPVNRIMLHHVLFSDRGRRDGDRHDGACPKIPRERIYGTGEEHQVLRLPPGYGIPIHAGERWQAAWMLMNHRRLPEQAYLRYRITVDTSRDVTPVKAFWLSVTGCGSPVYTVPGGAGPGAVDSRSSTWTVPANGLLVAGGAHLHGGATTLRLVQQRCDNRVIAESRALYGAPDDLVYRIRPVLHEPGPINTSWFTTAQGIPLAKGERISVVGDYDAVNPHTRVMAIDHVYMTLRGKRPAGCEPLPADLLNLHAMVPGRSQPPFVPIPLTGLDAAGLAQTIDRPPGPLTTVSGPVTVPVLGRAFRTPNLSIATGATVTWAFADPVRHNVTVASGPDGQAFGSPSLRDGGTYAHRFTVPGSYRLYCTLHPVQMQQAIDVRPPDLAASTAPPSDAVDW